jgi:hypothetical protein
VGKRARRRGKAGGSPAAPGGPSSFADLGLDLDLDVAAADADVPDPTVDAELAGGLGVLTLKTAMSPGTRTE